MKYIALNPNTYLHLTDHLAPLCALLNMPLLLTDEPHAALVHALYPQVETQVISWSDFTPDYLAKHFDVCFQSEFWPKERFDAQFKPFEHKYHKTMRSVHCPHGFSDKVFWLKQCVYEDITLVYGQNMLDLFRQEHVDHLLGDYVRVGNYRYLYYQQHQAFFDTWAQENVFKCFAKQQPFILYAPTHRDQEESTSFFHSHALFEQLPDNYNLLVKIHPAMEEKDGPRLYQLLGRYEGKGNIRFIKDIPLVYPLLAQAAVYVGDTSSIGYDFLVFNRPMIFLNQLKRTDRNAFLYSCGIDLIPEKYTELYQVIEQQLQSDPQELKIKRDEMYKYTFDQNVSLNKIKNDLNNIIK